MEFKSAGRFDASFLNGTITDKETGVLLGSDRNGDFLLSIFNTYSRTAA
ncbi:hypothetical protein [Salibacter halophilus]|nr:hypothetical protein [Salibacter halophilus]